MSPGNLPEIIAADLLDTLSLYAVAMICTTMVKIQTDRHTDRQHFDQLVYELETVF